MFTSGKIWNQFW